MTDVTRQDVLADALVSLLNTDATLAGLSEGNGAPAYGEPLDPYQEHVWVYERVDSVFEVELTGGDVLMESELMQLRVGIFVGRIDDDRVSLRDRSTDLTSLVHAKVREQHHLGLTQAECYFAHVTRIETYSGVWSGGMGLHRIVEVTCEDELAGSI